MKWKPGSVSIDALRAGGIVGKRFGIRVHLQTQGQDQHVKKGRVTDKAKRKKLRIEDNQYRQDNCDEREQFPPSFEVPRPCRSNSMRRANKPVADDCQSNQDEE